MIEKHAKEIAIKILGEPNAKLSRPDELRYGSFGSLSIDLTKGVVFDHEENAGYGLVDLIKKHGHDPKSFLDDMGINDKKPEIIKTYDYYNLDGELVYDVVRLEPKSFRQRRKTPTGMVYGLKGITPLPYNLNSLSLDIDLVFICEGEKDCDRLKKMGLVASCNSGGAGNWQSCINKYFEGKEIIILPDNDEPGEKHAKLVSENLQGIAKSIKILNLPVKEKGDVSDWINAGGTSGELIKLAKDAETNEPTQPFQSFKAIDPLSLPTRDFIYGKWIRKFCSLTIGQGGLGKSTLVQTEAIAIATGRDLLGIQPKSRAKVCYLNAEAPLEETLRKCIAICQTFKIQQEELEGYLFLSSGRDEDLTLASGINGEIQEANFQRIHKFCEDNGIDVLILDPLVNLIDNAPETNEVLAGVIKRLSRLADQGKGMSVEIVHHTRKTNNQDVTIESSRGGSSLVNGVRYGRFLVPMDVDTGVKSGVDNHLNYFRVEDGKNNLTPPDKARWFEKSAEQLANSDFVAVVKPWKYPDAFDGITKEMARKVQILLDQADPPKRENLRASDWAGKIVADVCELDVNNKSHKSKITTIIKTWLDTNVLQIFEEHDARTGRNVKCLRSGDNHL